jgi:hypothetical protein
MALCGGSMSWNPGGIPNINAWYAADSLGLSDGTSVSSWSDSSGNNFTATQATGAKQPVYHTNQINGLPALTFDGANMLMSSGADSSYIAGLTVFAVFLPSSVTTNIAIIGAPAGAGLEWRQGTAGKMVILKQNTTNIGTATNANSISTWQTASLDYGNVGTSAFHFFKNGTANGGTTSSTILATGQTMRIGATSAPADFWNGQIAEIITYERVLTATERAQVDSYFQDKYAIAVSDYLPSGNFLALM